jgi:hypothetical protein
MAARNNEGQQCHGGENDGSLPEIGHYLSLDQLRLRRSPVEMISAG